MESFSSPVENAPGDARIFLRMAAATDVVASSSSLSTQRSRVPIHQKPALGREHRNTKEIVEPSRRGYMVVL